MARPRTAVHRPEGDPPWLASMYAPDPRLPPEQQMLPTHAKRMAREQWEKDGSAGQYYDRDGEMLSVHPDVERKNYDHNGGDAQGAYERDDNEDVPLATKAPGQGMGGANWPLANDGLGQGEGPRAGGKRDDPTGRTASPAKQDPPKPKTGNMGLFPSPSQGNQQPHSPRTATPAGQGEPMGFVEPKVTAGPEDEDGVKKRGGCGCCVVM